MATRDEAPDQAPAKTTADNHSRPGWPYLLGAFVFLLVGVMGFGAWVGLRPLYTAIVFACIIVLVGLLMVAGAVTGERAARRLRAKLARCACPECGATYGPAVKYDVIACFDAPGGVVVRCPHCSDSAQWTHEAKPRMAPGGSVAKVNWSD